VNRLFMLRVVSVCVYVCVCLFDQENIQCNAEVGAKNEREYSPRVREGSLSTAPKRKKAKNNHAC
jgi:hypothetical protein